MSSEYSIIQSTETRPFFESFAAVELSAHWTMP
jgi:hypothetical protein